ncbi:cache domain-containing protein [Brevibacillus invocatus]|nr:cache domain-containing protein [Brevibacillus invocatus]
MPILFTVVVFLGYSQSKMVYYQSGIAAMDRQLNNVIQIMNMHNEQVKTGIHSFTEAEKRIRKLLSTPKQTDGTLDISQANLTLVEGNELFVFNSQGILVIHPSKEGQNIFNIGNFQGNNFAKKVLFEGNRVVTYTWSEPDTSQQVNKIASVKYFPQWDWYITLVSDESSFYEQLSQVKSFLIMLVSVSYLITAILFYRTYRKEKAFVSSKLRSVQLAEVNQSILKTLAVALEERDAYTSGHSQRVAYYMRVIGKSMGLDENTLDIMYTGGLLHDIGKIGIEDSILLKPGRLTEDEIEVIKSHPVRGEALLRKLYAHAASKDIAHIHHILMITRHHHERFDGTGYPDQLKEEQIPIMARVAAVADSFDAMTSSRAYRRGLSFSTACDEIIQNAGTQFCPKVVDAFFQSVSEETYRHAHHISRANELLQPIVDDTEVVYTQQPIRG